MEETVPCKECGKPISAVAAGKRNGMCLLCSVKNAEKVPCTECGKPVSVQQAGKRNGNPFFVLYSSLIGRVCNSEGGFDALSDPEKIYYTLTLFQNEINNGGFHQFFFNRSGAYYELVENGLVTFDEPGTLELLHRAKQILFPDISVSTDQQTRREQLDAVDPTGSLMSKLDELDQQFYRRPDTLSPKLQTFAREKRLVSAEINSTQG